MVCTCNNNNNNNFVCTVNYLLTKNRSRSPCKYALKATERITHTHKGDQWNCSFLAYNTQFIALSRAHTLQFYAGACWSNFHVYNCKKKRIFWINNNLSYIYEAQNCLLKAQSWHTHTHRIWIIIIKVFFFILALCSTFERKLALRAMISKETLNGHRGA